jgi:hypothetical protein
MFGRQGLAAFVFLKKNGLPVDVPIKDGMSPLGEVMRITHGLLLLGFHFYGSGGVPVVNGFVSPSANSKAATDSSGGRDGATFETAQTVENKVNFTMDQLCERGSIIAMFVAGKALPAEFHDKSLPPGEQAMCLGTYRVLQCAQEDSIEPDDIKQMLAFYKDHYALDSCMLRFHLAYKKKYLAVPVAYDRRAYRHIEVDKRDDRKPLFAVPEEATYRSLLSSDASIFISEKQMISDWIQDGGHLELVDDPYQEPGKCDPSNGNAILRRLHSATTAFRPSNKRMAHRAKRKIQCGQHWIICLKAAVALFARQLKVNVDADGKIGPLIDSFPIVHTAASELTNYSHFVGIGSSASYLESVGPELQKSPTTHPIRTYDSKVLWLMECNGGGPMRDQRDGMRWMLEDKTRAADLFFQGLVIEVVKVQDLVGVESCILSGGTPPSASSGRCSDSSAVC